MNRLLFVVIFFTLVMFGSLAVNAQTLKKPLKPITQNITIGKNITDRRPINTLTPSVYVIVSFNGTDYLMGLYK